MGKGAIPDRWLNYIPVGKPVEGTRFIAFKVPLRQEILQRVDDYNTRLDIDKLLKTVPNLGLIIDLTNTDRYYNPRQFIENGVQHIKLCVPGHQVPEKHLRARFSKYVKMFLQENKYNDKLIGVHCTHGVNRSGFLICDHMINEDNFDPKVAVERFASARGHPIERQNYISALLINKILERKNDKKETTRTIKPEEKLQYTYLPLKVERSTESYYHKPRDNERSSSRHDIHNHRSLHRERNRFDPINYIERPLNNGNRDRYESQLNPRNHVEYSSSSATKSYERYEPIRKNSRNFTEISRRFTPEDRDDAYQKISNYNTNNTANNWMNYEERSFKQDNCYNSSTNNLLNTYNRNRSQYKWERKDEQQTTAATRPREDDHYLRRPEVVQSRPLIPYHQSERPNYRKMEEPPTFRGAIRERLPYTKRKI